ncbi:hypothetical protein [Candidatus Nitrospira bockiana]
MTCPRCQGLMLKDACIDLLETQSTWIVTHRCVNCGHIADAVVTANRQRQSMSAVAPFVGSA